MGILRQTMSKRAKEWDKATAKTYAVGAIEAGVIAAPGPQKTHTATGRARFSMATSAGHPAGFLPALAAVYPIPNRASALQGISNRKEGESVFIDSGVPYQPFVEMKYSSIQAAHMGGVEAVKTNQRKLGGILSG